MKITWADPDSEAAPIVLADDTQRIYGHDWEPTWSQINQLAPRPRAAKNRGFNRQNRSAISTFTVTRGFDTVREAEEFCHDHIDELPGQGSLIFTLGAIGEETTTRTYPDALFVTLRHRHGPGVKVVTFYTFQVFEMNSVQPGDTLVTSDGGDAIVTDAGDGVEIQ